MMAEIRRCIKGASQSLFLDLEETGLQVAPKIKFESHSPSRAPLIVFPIDSLTSLVLLKISAEDLPRVKGARRQASASPKITYGTHRRWLAAPD
jgi:hypothetical protein